MGRVAVGVSTEFERVRWLSGHLESICNRVYIYTGVNGHDTLDD